MAQLVCFFDRAARRGVKAWTDKRILRTLRVMNILNGILMLLAAILSLLSGVIAQPDFATVTTCGYTW